MNTANPLPPDKFVRFLFHHWATALTTAEARPKLRQSFTALVCLWASMPESTLLDLDVEELVQQSWQEVGRVQAEAQRIYQDYVASPLLSETPSIYQEYPQAMMAFPPSSAIGSYSDFSAFDPSTFSGCRTAPTPRSTFSTPVSQIDQMAFAGIFSNTKPASAQPSYAMHLPTAATHASSTDANGSKQKLSHAIPIVKPADHRELPLAATPRHAIPFHDTAIYRAFHRSESKSKGPVASDSREAEQSFAVSPRDNSAPSTSGHANQTHVPDDGSDKENDGFTAAVTESAPSYMQAASSGQSQAVATSTGKRSGIIKSPQQPAQGGRPPKVTKKGGRIKYVDPPYAN